MSSTHEFVSESPSDRPEVERPGAGPGSGVCSLCSTPGLEPFYEVSSVPTNDCVLIKTPEEAKAYPRGDVRLAVCRGCGFIANVAFDPVLTEYSARYEETQVFSGTFNSFHRELAEGLVNRHHLFEKDLLEIGCGKGEFLSLLVDLGRNRGVGFDPGYQEGRDRWRGRGQVEFRKEFFTAAHTHLEADFICCKMTLEHVHEPAALVSLVRDVASHREGAVVFFQVPDVTRILEEYAFEDVYYEHCSYFGPVSLGRLFRRFGFEILNMKAVYGNQYLTVEAALGDGTVDQGQSPNGELARHLALVAGFAERCPAKLRDWEARLADYKRQGRRVALWGSGSKAVSFLTSLRGSEVVEHVVDINPYRQGHFMPGSGQPILAPEELVGHAPDVVVIMNRVYREEISSHLGRLGLSPQVEVL